MPTRPTTRATEKGAGVSKPVALVVNHEQSPKPKSRRGGARPNTGGARPGAGRKSKAEEMELRALLDKCWTAPDREGCVTALARKARSGDMEATKLLFNYAFGRPKEHKEVSGSKTIRVIYEDQPIEAEGAT